MISASDVRALRDWLRTARGVRWSERKCMQVLARVDVELARHRVMARRATLRQGELDERPASDAELAVAFANLRRMLNGEGVKP
ncbi:MAG: hypothetical protein FGM22_08410 [Burkholderiaceae bacterium]|nr:hypothetical protein [Burkholderiaceae bacterium]